MKVAGISDIGRTRKINQDNIFLSNEPLGDLQNLFIVADGMGGHNAGEYASKCAVDFFVEYILSNKIKTTKLDYCQMLKHGIEKINEMIYNKSQNDKKLFGMGTTFLVATTCNERLYAANVGDSRLYLINDKIEKLTKDHSLVEEMFREGEITKSEAENHPQKNIITRAVGVKQTIDADVFEKNLKEYTHLLMCSDGLTNMIAEENILSIIKSHNNVEKVAKKLVDKSNENGGFDNISVILIQRNKGVGE